MIVPLANALFEKDLNINDFYKNKKNNIIKNLTFKKVNPKIFPVIKLKKEVTEYPSTPIIINSANEILVDQFLKKKIPFLSIIKIILSILSNRNYIKNAIIKPSNINQNNLIDIWARRKTLELLKQHYE